MKISRQVFNRASTKPIDSQSVGESLPNKVASSTPGILIGPLIRVDFCSAGNAVTGCSKLCPGTLLRLWKIVFSFNNFVLSTLLQAPENFLQARFSSSEKHLIFSNKWVRCYRLHRIVSRYAAQAVCFSSDLRNVRNKSKILKEY